MKASIRTVSGVRRSRVAVAVVAAAGALWGAAAMAGTYSFSPTFETNRQSIWGTGQSAVSIDLQNQFLGARWGQSDQGGPAAGETSSGNFTNGNGFRLRGETKGRIGLEYGLKIDSGSIDASLPWDISINTPNANTLVSGQKFVVDTAATFRSNEATFVTRSPTFQMYSDFVFDVDARMSGQASIDIGFFSKQVTFDKQILDISAHQELIAINRDNDGGIRVLPFLFSSASNVAEAYDNAQATKELKQELNQTTKRREKVKVTLRKLGVSFDLGSPVEASVGLPYIEMNGSTITRDGNKLKQSDKDGFAEFTFDLDRIASILQPQIPPMTVNADLDFVVGTLSTSATLIDVDFVPTLNLTQTAEVDARRVKIDFDLGTNRAFSVLDALGNVVSTNPGARVATLTAGQKLELTYDGSEINLLPSYRVEAGLQNQFGLSISSQLQFRALMASLEARLFGLELGGFSLGPAFETAIDFPDISLGNLFDKTFDLTGFSAVDGPAVFISDKPAIFTGASGGNWATSTNWTVGASTGQSPDIGRSAIVPAGKNVLVTGAGNASFHLEIGAGSIVSVATTLGVGGSIYNSGTLNLGSNQTINLEEDAIAQGDHTFYGGTFNLAGLSQVVLRNNPATPAISADLTITNATVNFENAAVRLQGGPGKLWFGPGATLNVRNAGGNPANQSVIGTAGGYGFDIIKYGTRPVAVSLTQGANLLVEFGSMATVFPDQNPTPAELKGGTAAVLSDMLTFNVGTGSTLSLKGAALASNLNGYSTPGTIVGARFLTAGTGQVRNVGSIKVAASIFNGNFVAAGGDNAAGVSTAFQGLGSTTGELTPVVNNGTMTFIARAGRNSNILTDGGGVAGPGEMQLIGYSNPVRMLPAGVASFTNVEGHTIRVDNAVVGGFSVGGGSFRFFNAGKLIADKNFGSGTGSLHFENGNDAVNGDVINTGLIRAQNGASITFLDGNYLQNNGTVEAGDLSSVAVRATTFNITSPNSSTVVLQGGSWKTEYAGRIEIGGFQISSLSTLLSNKSDLEVSANFASANAGIYIRRTNGTLVRPDQFATFRNESGASFRASTVSTINFADFENYGALDISNSTVTGVQNFAGGIVFGSGEVRMQQTSPGVAAVAGTVTALRSENNAQLTVSAPAGVTTLQNNGVMGALGADLVFPANLYVQSSGGTLTGGKWAVEGGTTAFPDSARIIIPLTGSNLTGLTNTTITLKGPLATLDSSNNGASFRSIQTTLTSINSGAILTLDNNTRTFANRLTINTGGQLILANAGAVAGTGLDVHGLLAGNGQVNAPVKTFAGTLEAENGLLTFNANVDNTAVVGGFSGTILANDPGAVLNPKGVAFNGGRLIINSIGAGLYGSGLMTPATFQSKGVVAADTATLDFSGSGSFTNTGMMTTRERGILQFSGGMTLGNTSGTVSAVDTGGLDLQSDGGGIGGTVRLKGATISGGSVLISGYTAFANGSTNATTGTNARLDGYGSLSNVTLNISRGQLNVDPVAVPGGTNLNITPAPGVPAVFYASSINVSNGGSLNLNNGTFSAGGSTLTINNNSVAYLFGARLEDAKIVTNGTGELRVADTAPGTLANIKNTGRVSVFAGATLRATGTIDNRGGTIDNRGTLSLSDADLVGGGVINNLNSTIAVPGRAQILGSNLRNFGLLRVDATGNLTVNQSTDGTSAASSLNNSGTLTVAGAMRVLNSSFITTGGVTVASTGSLTATQITQNGGNVRINGTAVVTTYTLNAGVLYGAGRIAGSLINIGGSVQPGNSPGTLTVDGEITSTDDSEYIMQVEFTDTFDRIVSLGGDIRLNGRLILDFNSVLPEALGAMLNQQVSFDMFDVAPGYSIHNEGLIIDVDGGGMILPSNVNFDPATGSLSLYIAPIPEPAALALLAVPALALTRRRR
jgi:adhesin HecA-like repeat protein